MYQYFSIFFTATSPEPLCPWIVDIAKTLPKNNPWLLYFNIKSAHFGLMHISYSYYSWEQKLFDIIYSSLYIIIAKYITE